MSKVFIQKLLTKLNIYSCVLYYILYCIFKSIRCKINFCKRYYKDTIYQFFQGIIYQFIGYISVIKWHRFKYKNVFNILLLSTLSCLFMPSIYIMRFYSLWLIWTHMNIYVGPIFFLPSNNEKNMYLVFTILIFNKNCFLLGFLIIL